MQTRRDFLKLSLATTTVLSMSSFLKADEEFDDYKALVVIYQSGGNDSLNMFIPCGDDENKGYATYEKIRENLKVENNELTLPLDDKSELDLSSSNPYDIDGDLANAYLGGFYKHNGLDIATNALMPELAHLINQQKVAIVANCGNLIEPATKEEFENKTKQLPPFLFAHNHQTKLVMNGEASKLDFSGWAGRLYDRWKDINGGDIYGMNIAIKRSEHLFYGNLTTPLVIDSRGPSSYKRIARNLYDNFLNTQENDKFLRYYNEIKKHSFKMQDTLVDDWENNSPVFSSTNAYKGELFSYPSDDMLDQKNGTSKADTSMLRDLNAVAKLAYIGKNRGLKREIFFVYDGGYDTHSNQKNQHSRKLRGLSLGLGDFYKALKEMGMENNVTVFNISDFGRSSGDNGDGSDHAWGGSYFVLGGSVKGGLYGKMPDLRLGSKDDLTKKGRLIPTTSMSQHYATILKWFGVDEELMDYILPELKNFSQKNLGFMI